MGTVDLFHSRRTYFAECKYWIREESAYISNSSEWVLKHVPSGSFYAREISPQYNQFGQIGNSFQYNKDGITLESDDDLSELTVGSIILYNGKTWRVDNVQKEIHRKESQFNVEIDYKYIVSIRR